MTIAKLRFTGIPEAIASKLY